MKTDESEWGAMRSQWHALEVPEQLAAGMLRSSLRWRILVSRIYFAMELVSFLLLIAIAAVYFATAQFGKALSVSGIFAVCLTAILWARHRPVGGNMDSLVGMIDLALGRARRTLRLVYATYVILVALVGWQAWDYSSSVPGTPAADPDRAVANLIAFAITAIATVGYHLYTRARLRRFQAIRQSFEAPTHE